VLHRASSACTTGGAAGEGSCRVGAGVSCQLSHCIATDCFRKQGMLPVAPLNQCSAAAAPSGLF
jgi:hypothetical protein